MNGRKGKMIRYVAERKTVGLPMVSYKQDGKHIVLAECTRKSYKKLKQEFKSK